METKDQFSPESEHSFTEMLVETERILAEQDRKIAKQEKLAQKH